MTKDGSYGVIVVLRGNPDRFLILRQKDITSELNWSFPKGHSEEGESVEQTIRRELLEETGITEITFLDCLPLFEHYVFTAPWNGITYDKTNEYRIGMVLSDTVIPQEKEIAEYRWATYEEALETISYKNRKELLKAAKQYIETYAGK